MRSFNDPGAEYRRGGCSAFIATGDATADHRPVAAHNMWTPVLPFCTFNFMFFMHPDKGYDLTYQSAGGQIWSGVDWYENSAGPLFTETSRPDSVTDPRGTPVFVRLRTAVQFSDTVAEAARFHHDLLRIVPKDLTNAPVACAVAIANRVAHLIGQEEPGFGPADADAPFDSIPDLARYACAEPIRFPAGQSEAFVNMARERFCKPAA